MLVMGLKLLLVAGLLSCCSKWLCNGVMMTGSQLSHPMNYGVVQFFGVFTNSRVTFLEVGCLNSLKSCL